MRKKLAHPHPERVALASCQQLTGRCLCKERGSKPWHILDRLTCERQYQAAIQAIIADIQKGDPPHP